MKNDNVATIFFIFLIEVLVKIIHISLPTGIFSSGERQPIARLVTVDCQDEH